MPKFVIRRPAFNKKDLLKNLNIPEAKNIIITEIPRKKRSVFPHYYKISFSQPKKGSSPFEKSF